MAKRGRRKGSREKKSAEVKDYRHDEAKRKNNPPVGMVSYETVREPEKKTYAYDPHLSPQLIWADKPGLKQIEVEDAAGVEVGTIDLHIHERISTQAIIDAVRKKPKQMTLFADPELPLAEAVRFYHHDVDWANRLILGDSLLVMNSLLERERMAGKVQMIYLDPPYGVKFSSNFQPRIDQRDVKDADDHLTREPEQIKAYRDTWTLGIHSYLTYLRDRLRLCRELLHESGSIFVQINDENLHHVREVMDEVFGSGNLVSQIVFQKSSGRVSEGVDAVYDVLLWYARERSLLKFRKAYRERSQEQVDTAYNYIELPDGSFRPMTSDERRGGIAIPPDARRFRPSQLYSQTGGEGSRYNFQFKGDVYSTPATGGWRTNEEGLRRLADAERVMPRGRYLAYKMFADDFPYVQLHNIWTDVLFTAFGTEKAYVVQTSPSVVQRCMLMSTDPGDLVMDPTCGSGTTAYVAEQGGRRWITCDTSRVAVALARQRLLTATFPYYTLYDEKAGIKAGLVYKTVPHITLKSIAQNRRLDSAKTSEERKRIIQEDAPQETLYDQPQVDKKVVRVSGPFTVEAIPPPVQMSESPIGGAPQPEDQKEAMPAPSAGSIPHIPMLIELLRQDGVTFPDNKRMLFETLTAREGGVLHAEGEPKNGNGGLKRIAVSFGPQHGPVTGMQVEDGLREAYRAGFDAVVFCGFAFEGPAHAAIEASVHPKVKAFLAHIRPDVNLTDARGGSLLKTTASSQLFTAFGEPDAEPQKLQGKDEYQITLKGVDVYDPMTGEVHSATAEKIAAWFVDTDYDGRTFCVCQAFFPNKSAWGKIERALKGTLDEEKFDLLTGTVSLPFEPGKHKRAAVKVIDQRGNEVMRVLSLRGKAK
ncbi:MAG: site-specific DNA-methyltransferase [Phycisphaerae bacterium]|nr:site-specific DNA-methyltransferase [Phycisphaerae bacterium]